MKLFRFALNIWITIVSIGSFLIGWVALAHSPKPVSHALQSQTSVGNVAPLPTLAPLQLNGSNSSNFQTFQVAPSTNSNNGFFSSAPQPIFRTGGS